MTGTACAVALVSCEDGSGLKALSVFREDYARQKALVGRSSEISSEPLTSFAAKDFHSAAVLSVLVTEVLDASEPGSEPEPVPPLREEYLSLRTSMAQAIQFTGVPAPAAKSGDDEAARMHVGGSLDCSRRGLADALMERRAAEAAQPGVVSMAMDWLWSRGGQSTWLTQPPRPRPQRSSGSAPPSSHRPKETRRSAAEVFKLQGQKGLSPHKASCGSGRFGSTGHAHAQHPTSRPAASLEFDTPAPLTMVGVGPATLSRADSPETPPAARMRRQDLRGPEAKAAAQVPVSADADPGIEDIARRRCPRQDSTHTALTWGFCSLPG